ncbi:MAG: glycoside hydrolase family 9 protein [Ruminococcus sp.]|nr:glycoside hydrolase family 9 protein [Ruminococcus sp.]
MHKKFFKAFAGSLMSAAMLATAVTGVVAPMSASAGQVLGETSFEYKALPWHTCESSPAKQNFAIEGEAVHISIVKAEGADKEKWDLQFRHRNLNFKSGHKYTVSFTAKASRAGLELCSKIGNIKGDEEYCVVNGNEGTMQMGPHMGGQWGNAAKLTTEYQTYKGTFTPTQDLEGAEWAFHYAKGTKFEGNAQDGDEIWFDEMSIVCETCDECNADPQASYGAVNRDYSTTADSRLGTIGATKNFISVNQIGYYTNLKKIATLGDNAGDILHGATKISLSGSYDFELIDVSSGTAVYTGKTSEVKADKDSADNICTLDFSEYNKPGRYYLQIKGQDWRSFEFYIGDNIYYDESHNLLTNAMNYFYQNRSGVDIEDKYCTSGGSDGKGTGMGHKGGHATDTATIQKIWKNEYASKEEATSTYKSGTLTASGGWYDAGDHGKYVVNGGISIWTLQNMYERAILQDGYDKKFDDNSGVVVIPEAGNKVPDVLDEAAVELDWIAQMKVVSSDSAWGKYDGLYYHKLHDHKWTGLATRPWDYESEWETVRIVKPPTLAATLNYAACAAQAARLWEPYDSAKAKTYLESAKEAFAAYEKHWYAYDDTDTTHPELNCPCKKEELNENSLYAPMWHAKGGGPYGDDNVLDDAYWAACEIFVSASQMGDSDASTYKSKIDDPKYADYAYKVGTRMIGGENKGSGSFTSFNWGNTASAGSLTLALHSDLLSDSENSEILKSVKAAADAYIECEGEQGYGIPYKYDGPDYNDPNNLDPKIMINGYEWGSNSMVINNCIVMAYAYDLTKDINYMNGVATGLDYLFGRNPLSYSFVTGYGTYKEHNPHHRYWSYELDKTLPMAPDGILSGGPNAGLQDPYVRALGFVPGKTTNPSQRCFVDSIEAWSTNEVTINWNAPLAWIASFMQDEAAKADPNGGGQQGTTKPTTGNTSGSDKTLWGDANCDGEVNIADATAIVQALGNKDKYELEEQGAINADIVDNGGGVTGIDALALSLMEAGRVTQPEFPLTLEKFNSISG